jgi:hypothetical protein
LVGLSVVVACGAFAGADTIILNNGGKIEGIVSEEGEWYLVEMDAGTARIRKSEVATVIEKNTTLEEYRERAARVPETDAQGHYQLGLWCKSVRLNRCARLEFQKTIVANHDHVEARKELGYVKHEGTWMTEDQAMAARGFVKYEGSWIPREERDLRESLKAKEKLEAQVKKAEAEARKAEMEAKLAHAKRDLADAQRELAEARQRRDPSAYNQVPYYGGFSWIWTSPYYNAYPYYYGSQGGYWTYANNTNARRGGTWTWHPYQGQYVVHANHYPHYPCYYSTYPYYYYPYYPHYPYYYSPGGFQWWITWD